MGDAAWEPLVMTPPFQEYISTHRLLPGNGAELLARFFGTDAIPVTGVLNVPQFAPVLHYPLFDG